MCSAAGQYMAGKATRGNYRRNAERLMWQGVDRKRQGEVQVSRYREKSEQFMGSQRAAMASSGFEVTAESADAIRSSAFLSERDVVMLENNTARDIWGLQAAAGDQRQLGRNAYSAAMNQAFSSFLSEGMSAASMTGQFG